MKSDRFPQYKNRLDALGRAEQEGIRRLKITGSSFGNQGAPLNDIAARHALLRVCDALYEAEAQGKEWARPLLDEIDEELGC